MMPVADSNRDAKDKASDSLQNLFSDRCSVDSGRENIWLLLLALVVLFDAGDG